MRSSHVATALAAFTAGLSASAALRRLTHHRLPKTAAVTAANLSRVAPVLGRDAVVLPFTQPVLSRSVPEQLGAPARCGDSGGRTKAGAPCAARASSGGRCHHHPMAA